MSLGTKSWSFRNIEVSKSYYDQVPQEYIRKQTLANCERYITQELKELENTILSASDRVVSLEYDLFVPRPPGRRRAARPQ